MYSIDYLYLPQTIHP